MASKSSFTAEEWSVVREAPHQAALAVAIAGASGVVGTLKEAFSSAAALVEGTKSDNELVRTLCARDEVREVNTSLKALAEELKGADLAAAKRKVQSAATDKVRAAAQLVRSKGTPSDAAAYASFVQGLGARVANAAKEGSFLGFGGERLSADEKAMLAQLEAALASPNA